MMLPILISVSVAPVSYFFCASAPLVEAANRASAVEAMARRVACIKVSPFSKFRMIDVGFLDRKLAFDWALRYHFAAFATTKSPCDKSAGAAALIAGFGLRSAADVGADDIAEAFPSLALEPLQLYRRDRGEIGRRRVNLDARQQARDLEVLHACRLLHDVLPGQVVAAVLQHVNQTLGNDPGIHDGRVGAVCLRVVLVEERVPGLHC